MGYTSSSRLGGMCRILITLSLLLLIALREYRYHIEGEIESCGTFCWYEGSITRLTNRMSKLTIRQTSAVEVITDLGAEVDLTGDIGTDGTIGVLAQADLLNNSK